MFVQFLLHLGNLECPNLKKNIIFRHSAYITYTSSMHVLYVVDYLTLTVRFGFFQKKPVSQNMMMYMWYELVRGTNYGFWNTKTDKTCLVPFRNYTCQYVLRVLANCCIPRCKLKRSFSFTQGCFLPPTQLIASPYPTTNINSIYSTYHGHMVQYK